MAPIAPAGTLAVNPGEGVSMSSQVSPVRGARRQDDPRFTLACSECGYGIARPTPPERCPMCQRETAWVHRVAAIMTRDPGG